ncbi:MAG: DEAD/DEAH box helicase [Fusobacteriaceae bacterium]
MNLKTELLPHQKEAYEKMKKIKVGALFMEMGTGKTRTTLELIKFRLEEGKIDKVVWFTPVSTKENLLREIQKHSDISVFVYDSKTNPETKIKDLISIVGIESTISDRVKLSVNDRIDSNTMIVVDESTFIKNRNAKRSAFIGSLSLKSVYKLILNGTPTTNSVSDLYHQFGFLSHKILGYSSFSAFSKTHLKYDERIPGRIVGSVGVDKIMDRISSYTFSVKKSDCLVLPKKIYKNIRLELVDNQKYFYEKTKEKLLFESYESGKEMDILLLFTKLQQVSSGFIIEKDKVRIFGTEKTEALKNIISLVGGKLVVFYKYRAEEHYIKKSCSSVSFVHGGVSLTSRDKIIKEFEKNDSKMLAINLSCGSYGLNLQFVNTVVYFSNKFNFAERLQSEDRFHRFGQASDVTYYDFVSSNMEQHILDSIKRKENLLDHVTKTLKNKNNDHLKIL